MNLILHQFTTDLRHFRGRLIGLWLLFALEPFVANLSSLPGEAIGILGLFVTLAQALVALALIASLVQADALVGTEAAWLTRPLRRNHLFWAKTAFLVLGLIAPRLALQVIGWALRGYSPYLMLCGAGESLLFTVPFVFAVATLAALTLDLSRFFLAVGIAVGGVFAWVVVVEMLRRGGVLDEPTVAWQDRATRNASAVVAAFLCTLACAVTAWVAQARGRLWRVSVAGLAAGLMTFPVIVTVWANNFLLPQPTQSAPLALAGEVKGFSLKDPRSQPLSTELVVQGVPERRVAITRGLSAQVLFAGDRRPTFVRRASSFSEFNASELRRGNAYVRVIQGFFPTNTLWFNESFNPWLGSAFYDEAVAKRFPNGAPPGALSGEVELDLFAIEKVAEVPLRPAAFTILPGRRLALDQPRLAGGVISVPVNESAAQLLLDRKLNLGGSARGSEPFCTYVLYHPGSGEAYLIRQSDRSGFIPRLLGGETHHTLRLRFPYPALRERLAGVTAAQWLREARLWIFAPVYDGSSRLAFRKEDFHWSAGGSNARAQQEEADATAAIAQATLPANPTPAQLEAYLDTVLNNAPESCDQPLRDAIRKKLAAVGTNGLPALLRRLPLGGNLGESAVLPVVSQFVTRAHLAELRAALERDSDVVRVFTAKQWEADARAALVARLRDHRQPMPADALRFAAEAHDPASYADLRWHFVRLNYGHDRVLAALEQCPGFDTAAAVREAWRWAQLGLSNDDHLAVAAAMQGLPEALSRAVIDLENTQDSTKRDRDVPRLAALTGYTGPTNQTLVWLGANLGRFRFDEARQRYVVQLER